VLNAVLAQQGLIQRIARLLSTGMGVHVNQTGHKPPTIDDRFCRCQRLQRDPAVSDVQVAFLIIRQNDAA
jgi:hypothetical protein